MGDGDAALQKIIEEVRGRPAMKIALTGANSAVGQTLLTHIAAKAGMSAIAGVRSDRAAESLPVAPNIEPRIIDYGNHNRLAVALAGCQCVVHLAGILIEAKGATYESANVDATKSVVEAAKQAGLEHIILISALGADENAQKPVFKIQRGMRNGWWKRLACPPRSSVHQSYLAPARLGRRRWCALCPKAKHGCWAVENTPCVP